MEKEIKELVNDAEYIYGQLSCDGIPIPFDIERALFESIGRLTISDDSAIRFLKEFIEEQYDTIRYSPYYFFGNKKAKSFRCFLSKE